MRGQTVGVPSPHPLIGTLPGLYQDDPVARQWMSAFDEVLAPIFATIDNLPAYLDPWLTPEDFLPWLASWVSVVVDPARPLDRRRALVANAISLYRWRGTARGIAAAVELATGILPEVRDSGGIAWSRRSGSTPPGQRVPEVFVLLRCKRDQLPDATVVRQAVELAVPAHVSIRIEVATA